MLKYIMLLVLGSTAWAQSFTPRQQLENYSLGNRNSGAGQPLWRTVTSEGEGDQVLTIAAGAMTVQGSQHTNCTTEKGCGIYWLFYSKGGGFTYPNQYTQHFVMSPDSYVPGSNHMQFHFQCVNAVPHTTANNSQVNNMQLGTYIRDPTSGNTGFQGQHYYHYYNFDISANQDLVVDWNIQPQHVVTVSSLVHYDPEEPGTPGATQNVQYLDGLTEWYFDTQNAPEFGWTQWAGNTCQFTNFQLYTATAQPESYVAGEWISYNGTAYVYGFSTPFSSPQNITYDIAYATASLRTNGWASGSSGGTVTPTSGTGYVAVSRTLSPTMAKRANLYLGIRPHIPITAVSGTSPITITTYTDHLLTTGAQVTISGLSSCTAANGLQTITSTAYNTFTLNGTSGAGCSFNAGGTFVGQEFFSEVNLGASSAPVGGSTVGGKFALGGTSSFK